LFRNRRFISLTEYQNIFKDKASTKDFKELKKRYPAYKLFEIGSVNARNRFINSRSKNLDGYFEMMEWKNKKLRNIFNRSYPVRLPDSKGKHWYVVGGTGSGKSELLKHLMIQDIEKKDKAIILIEPNGDLSEQIARQQCLEKDRLVYIDCSLPSDSPSINPFDLINIT
jgi:DNA helicase HerA-like ATPase